MRPTSEDIDVQLSELRQQVSDEVSAFLERQSRELLAVSPDVLPLVESLTDLLAGGKRLRPTFAFWGWRAAGGAPSPEIVRAAASLEFLQACALIHDDVMDGSDTRRGMPAAHRRLATLHRSHGYLGSSEAFGVGAAILLGDLCLSWADEMLLTSGMSNTCLADAKRVFDAMRTELMAGQYLDLLAQARGAFDAEAALTVARYKSGKYTVERPLQLGAAAAGASPELATGLGAFGTPLGEAFQLRDDILGVFGDPEHTGKPAGDDLREGKRTVLVALAWKRADTDQRTLLRQHLGDPAISEPTVTALRAVIRDTGALSTVEDMIGERAVTCARTLDDLSIPAEPAAALRRLTVLTTRRSS